MSSKHHSNSHQNLHSLSVAAHSVLADYKKKLEEEAESLRLDYQRQLDEKSNDDWLRNLAMSGLVYREMTGSNSKTEKFLRRLAEKLKESKDKEEPTSNIVAELYRITNIEIEVSDYDNYRTESEEDA